MSLKLKTLNRAHIQLNYIKMDNY